MCHYMLLASMANFTEVVFMGRRTAEELYKEILPLRYQWIPWALAVVLMYYPCVCYGRFKSRQPGNSLWRLF